MKLFLKFCMILICAVFLSACTRLTQENFDKIQTGMPMSEVIMILGEPTASESVNFAGISGTSATWKDKTTVITIQFLNDKVQIKSFSHPEAGVSHDTPSADYS